MEIIRGVFAGIALLLLSIVAYQQYNIIENQRAQMRQQFHGDQITLTSFFGESGLQKVLSNADPKDLSYTETYATGLLLQRLLVSHDLYKQGVFNQEQWQSSVLDDARSVMRVPLMQKRWKAIREWYTKEEQAFINSLIDKK